MAKINFKSKYVIVAIITPILIWLDQITKSEVVQRFRLGESLPVIDGFFNLTYVRNTGAAFGILNNADPTFRIPFFIIVPSLALVAIVIFLRQIRDKDWHMAVALGLVISGAIGNLIDRIQYNFVIDFLDFHWKYKVHFPAFNVADMVICIGVGILMLDLAKEQAAEKAKKVTKKRRKAKA